MDFEYHRSEGLPPLAWLAHVASGRVSVSCGSSVRCEDGAFFEGTWAGAPGLASLPGATTVFGSGIVAAGAGLLVITPSHQLESVYTVATAEGRLASNSLAWLLDASGLALDPAADYPAIFGATREGIAQNPVEIRTLAAPVTMAFFENLRLDAAGRALIERKPREAPFNSFADYRERLRASLAACFVNAPRYEPLATLSAGYDSSAVAALAAGLGCRRAVGFRTAKRLGGGADVDDSGEASARRLGLDFSLHDRLAYRERDDLPEAEFLATGMPGEDVVFSAFEEHLRGALLLDGSWPSGVWSRRSPRRVLLERDDLSAASLTEFRLRTDCIVAHPAFFGATEQPSLVAISSSPEMRPFSVGGDYDRPIPRRIAEEAGLPRGSFATHKRAVSVNLNRLGAAGFAPPTLRAIESFAAAEGSRAAIPAGWRPRRRHRLAIRLGHALGVPGLVAGLERRRRASTHFAPQVGNLLLRWAVSVVAPRYRR